MHWETLPRQKSATALKSDLAHGDLACALAAELEVLIARYPRGLADSPATAERLAALEQQLRVWRTAYCWS